MKILHLINTLSAGGAELHLLTLCRQLKRHGVETVVACLRERVKDSRSLGVDFENEGIRVVRLETDGRFDLRFISRLASLIAKERPNILHTHLPRADIAGACRHLFHSSIPWVCSVHDIHDNSWSGRWTLPLFNFIWRRADRIVAISHAVKEWLIKDRAVPGEKISVIHYGIEPEVFSQSQPDLKLRLGLEGKVIIGAIGRLEPRKGHDCLIRAIGELKKTVSNISLVIAGHDPFDYGDELQSLIDSLDLKDQVRLVGFQSDIAGFLGALDIFAFATHSEGFGQVVIEAMAAGKPVVASRITPLTEIIREGETGLLVKPDDPQAFASAIAWLLTHPKQAQLMGKHGQQRVYSHFSAERMADETLSLYHSLLRSSHMEPQILPDSKIKILRIIGRLNVGGAAIHVINLTAGLDGTRYDQLLVVGSENPAEGSMANYALSRGVHPHVIPQIVTAFSLSPRDLRALAKLYALMRHERPHIVCTETAKAGFLGRLAARLSGVPVVVHTFHGHVLHGYYGPVKNWLMRRMEQSLARFTDRLVAVSEQVKSDLVGYGVAAEEKITVISLGFDLEPFLNSHNQRGEFRREMGLTGDIKLVGIVGRIFPIKNHALFLETAARISAQDSTTRFVIVGDGVLRAKLEQQTLQLGIADRVLFTGWRRDLPRIYADLDVLVVSSDNEGTPVSAIEAMAGGCPVVATRVGGLPDLIIDGESGRLVPPRNPEALAAAVMDLLQDAEIARRIGCNAKAAAGKRFAVKRLISDMDHLYTQLLEEKSLFFPLGEQARARR